MRLRVLFAVVFLTPVILCAATAWAGEEAGYSYSLWLGGHYTDRVDNVKKVGEYDLGNIEQTLPEAQLRALFRSDGKLLILDGHYYDDQNVKANLKATTGERMSLKLGYRSLIRQLGQDQLTNLAAKEATGGKILSHELKDPGADYNYNRHEITSDLNLQLTKKNDLRLVAAHRSILKKGHTQAMSTNHCWGCHVVSQGAELDTRTHEAEVGLDASSKKLDVGYRFAYRRFDSKAPAPMRYYDTASHPIDYTNPNTRAEFGSRVLYDDTLLAHNAKPKTEKMTHKVRLKTPIGKGRLATSFALSKTENKLTQLTSDAFSGAANYATLLSPTTRLVARASVLKVSNDDPAIVLPIFRDGRTGPADSRPDFSYTRLSSLDRLDAKFTAEMIRRLNRQWTLAVQAGFRRIDRDDYLVAGEKLVTNRLSGQAKLRFRKGLRYTSSLKYRFEKTSDPFTSSRGLFEAAARDSLSRPWAGLGSSFPFIFYFQREDLRYQAITTEPTQRHDFEWKSTYRPDPKLGLNLGFKGSYDKNSELDSLDVKHTMFQPSLGINVSPDPKWFLAGGYTFQHAKSRGPVTVALFDG